MTDTEKRKVDNWYLGPMLGKGGYSWVKTGFNIKTGKAVALKFMNKAEGDWIKEQAEQVSVEIEALKKISHANVMKLYAYNLNCQYPEKSGKLIPTILLVLEMAPGGELFDILYYTQKLEETVARSYFQQLMAGLKAIHKAGITHRDLKPQNLLMDKYFRLKITDFGLSNIFEDDTEKLMKTTYVGTKGYQAPELLLNRKYTNACDLFACGVILFIMLMGYPPFEEALASDSWYKCIAQKKYTKFWKKHSTDGKGNTGISEGAQELIYNLICYQPGERFTIKDVEENDWFKKKGLEQKELKNHLQKLHRQAVKKKRADPNKQEQLQMSEIRARALDANVKIPKAPEHLPLFNTHELVSNDNNTPMQNAYSVLLAVERYILTKKGQIEWDKTSSYELIGRLMLASKEQIEILVNIYEDEDEDGKVKNIVVFRRTNGSHHSFHTFFQGLFSYIREFVVDDGEEEKKEDTKLETEVEVFFNNQIYKKYLPQI